MEAAREHIERIRTKKFSIGGEENLLAEDLHQAVKNLSAELYEKDVHFLMELIQNAEDNEYPDGVQPSLEFVITYRDITATGAPATLLIFNNEKGFSSKNIDSVCSVGRSTKKGNRKRGYIGEKGIGFKSVFLITSQPHIFSNGYQIRFNEAPCPYCNLGYIVPEWVEQQPSLSEINQIYGSSSELPATTIILPLKADKIQPVKNQLLNVHPEVLLFLSKIKRLSFREHNEDPRLSTVNLIGITSETNFVTRKSIDAESYTIHLSAQESSDNSERQCSYYMWRQKFPVKPENRVERRMEVEEWAITLAFPYGERLNRGSSSPGVYAFLPTDMITNIPFIIQADFILQSSREKIQRNDKWNQGILGCVASAFISAFTSLVRRTDAPVSSLPPTFKFLPVGSSSYEELNAVRDSIRVKLSEEEIVPSVPHLGQKFFHKPREVGRLMPAFWDILKKARAQGVNLQNLSSHGIYILDSSFDRPENDPILNFLGLQSVGNDWYGKCIQGSNLVSSLSDDVYLELLLYLANNWQPRFQCSNMEKIPLIKYVDLNGSVSLCSISQCSKGTLCIQPPNQLSWLLGWNKEFRCMTNHFFMPNSMREAMRSCSEKETILKWLRERVEVVNMKVSRYAELLLGHLNGDRKLVVAYAHFLYHSYEKKYLSKVDVDGLCSRMPLVDNYGIVSARRSGVLVPSIVSKWVGLIGSNPWRQAGYVELGEDYLWSRNFAGENSGYGQLLEFLKLHVQASDIPHISPPDVVIPAVSGLLKKENAFLLLDWIRYLNHLGVRLPEKFLTSIQEGSWLGITLNGCRDCRPPSQSFFYTSSWGNILQNGSILVDIPLVDQSFYGYQINEYKQELKTAGVMFEYGEACAFIGKRLMSLAASSTLSKSNVFSMLNFIRYLREQFLPPDEFIHSIKKGRWLRTSCGDRSPDGAVLFDQEWRTASQISDIPFIDTDYYGDAILGFRTELELLGVVVRFPGEHSLVVGHLKPSSKLSFLTAGAMFLVLECMRHLSPRKLINALGSAKCFKTNLGYDCPNDCFLPDPEWGCLLKVFNCFHFIDDGLYGSDIFSYREELKQIGVVVEFEEAVTAFARIFRQKASSSSITRDNAMSLLSCYRNLKGSRYKFPKDLKSCIKSAKWLRNTLTGFSSPAESILFGPEWEPLRLIANLPFVDDGKNWYGMGIHEYKKELKSMGVAIELKDGVKLVASCLNIPSLPSSITAASALSLLKCIAILIEDRSYSLSEEFQKKVSANWLKTHAGYRSPGQCLLFDTKWGLKETDGPFIDEEFYGPGINSYRKELNAIGVSLNGKKACELLFNNLEYHSEFNAIVRIYSFLKNSAWKPTNEVAASKIYVPDGSKNGMWVDSSRCVLQDGDNLFGSELHVLEKHYEPELLIFISSAFNVRSSPSLDDYFKLWKVWEGTRQKLSSEECCAFWRCVMRHSSPRTEKFLAESLTCLPVGSDQDGIMLSNKNDVFIADDLLLKDLFVSSLGPEIFVWFPLSGKLSLPTEKLVEVYRNIGVRDISKCVERKELSLSDGVQFREIHQGNVAGRGLVKLILGFLADPSMKMGAKKRQETVGPLLNLTVLETKEPISVSYALSLSTGGKLNVNASRMIRWDKERSEFFTQKVERSSGQKNILEYATYFSEVISKGVLWEKEDQIGRLSELIKLAFLVELDEAAIGFLMKSRNLQIYEEDEEFLSEAFPSE